MCVPAHVCVCLYYPDIQYDRLNWIESNKWRKSILMGWKQSTHTHACAEVWNFSVIKTANGSRYFMCTVVRSNFIKREWKQQQKKKEKLFCLFARWSLAHFKIYFHVNINIFVWLSSPVGIFNGAMRDFGSVNSRPYCCVVIGSITSEGLLNEHVDVMWCDAIAFTSAFISWFTAYYSNCFSTKFQRKTMSHGVI